MRIDKAIKHYKSLQKRYTTQHNGIHCEYVALAIQALQEQQKRQSGCVWCKENGMVTHNGQHYELFCSHCGRRLEVEGKEGGRKSG